MLGEAVGKSLLFFHRAKRGILSFLKERVFKPHVVSISSESEVFQFYVGNSVGQDWYELEDHQSWPEMGFIRQRLITPGDFVVECGAHHGFTTILLSKWAGPKGKVVAFEANPENASIVLKNIEVNKITNVEVHMKAVGSSNGIARITKDSNAYVTPSNSSDTVQVPVVRLDDLFAASPPDLIKMDVEGYECEVVQGLHSTLAKRKTKLAIEVHCASLGNYGSSTVQFFDDLQLKDYDCWLGTGDEATEGIKPFKIEEDEIPMLSRIYLFAIPKQ